MPKKMNKVQRAIIVTEINALRGFCRFAARRHKAKGDLEKVKTWNDLAYRGDVLYMRVTTE